MKTYTEEFKKLAKKTGLSVEKLAAAANGPTINWQGKAITIYGPDVPDTKATVTTAGQISELEFWKRAIVRLRTGDWKGINPAYDRANLAFKQQFPNKNAVESVQALVKEGKIVSVPYKGKDGRKGGVIIYLPEEAPARARFDEVKAGQDALAKILAD